MIQFLITSEVSSCIERIIKDAKEHLVLVSPYVQLSSRLKERLETADRNGVAITLVYGKERKLQVAEQEALAGLSNLTVYYLDNLHAKCYYNERELVLTSMNLYQFSADHNYEMGVRVTSEEEVYENAVREAKTLIGLARPVKIGIRSGLQQGARSKRAGSGRAERPSFVKAVAGLADAVKRGAQPGRGRERGHCIRCGTGIEHNPERPFCHACYKSWAEFENPTYTEAYCHTCGGKEKTSFAKPECRSCYLA